MGTTYAEQTYVEKIAKIGSVKLGPEDHGIFTCMVYLDYGGSGQGAGGYALDAPATDENGRYSGRVGTAFGMEWIMRLMRAAGVDDFSKLEGRTVLALRENDGTRIVGLKPLPTEQGEPFVFSDLAAR